MVAAGPGGGDGRARLCCGYGHPPGPGCPPLSRTRRPPTAHPSDQPPPEAPHRPGWIPRRDLPANGDAPAGGSTGPGAPSASGGPSAGLGPAVPVGSNPPDGLHPTGRPTWIPGPNPTGDPTHRPNGADEAERPAHPTWGATRPGWALPAALIAMALVYPAAFAWQVVPFWSAMVVFSAFSWWAAWHPYLPNRLRPSRRLVAMGVLSGLGLYALFFIGAVLVQGTPLWPWIEEVVELTRGTAPAGLAALVIVFGTSPSEEVLWRGAVFARLTRRYGAGWRPVVMTSLAYALFVGLSLSPVLPLAALVCGLVWARQRQVTGSLVPSLVSHALWSLLMFLYIPGL
jgi:membrane protease YdiL (CAAX protease family)